MATPLPLPCEPEILATPTRRTLLTLILGALLVTLAVNLALIGAINAFHRNIDMHHAVVAGKWRTLAGMTVPPDILVVGDSSGLHGVDAQRIAAQTGRSCFNACAFGSLGLANEAWLVQHLAGLGRLPRLVVSVHVHDIWVRGQEELLPWLGDFPEGLEPWRHHEPRLEPAALPSASRFPDPFQLIKRPARARLVLSSLWSGQLWKEDQVTRLGLAGMVPQDRPDPANVLRDTTKQLGKLDGLLSGPTLSPFNRQAFLALITTLDKAGSSLVVVEAPACSTLSRHPSYVRHLEQIESELTSLAAGRASFRILRTGRDGFEAAEMQNADHLATSAARRTYTERIIQGLALPPAGADKGPDRP